MKFFSRKNIIFTLSFFVYLLTDDFRKFCLNKPEYGLLFIHFRKLKHETSSMTFSKAELRRGSISEADNEIMMPEVQV